MSEDITDEEKRRVDEIKGRAKECAREVFGRLLEAEVAGVGRRFLPNSERMIRAKLIEAGYDPDSEAAFTEGLGLSGGKRQYDQALDRLNPVHA